jgi:hypothetical protein
MLPEKLEHARRLAPSFLARRARTATALPAVGHHPPPQVTLMQVARQCPADEDVLVVDQPRNLRRGSRTTSSVDAHDATTESMTSNISRASHSAHNGNGGQRPHSRARPIAAPGF